VTAAGSVYEEYTFAAVGGLATQDFRVRGDFANWALGSDGTVRAFLDVPFFGDPSTPEVYALISLTKDVGSDSASFDVGRVHDDTFPGIHSTVPIDPTAVAILLAGGGFQIHLQLDRSNDIAYGWVDIGGYGTVTSGAISTAPIAGLSPGFILQSGGNDPAAATVPSSVTLDFQAFTIFSGFPFGLDIDIGAALGGPSPSEIPTGPFGEWNVADLNSSALVDRNGDPTAANIGQLAFDSTAVGSVVAGSFAAFKMNTARA